MDVGDERWYLRCVSCTERVFFDPDKDVWLHWNPKRNSHAVALPTIDVPVGEVVSAK